MMPSSDQPEARTPAQVPEENALRSQGCAACVEARYAGARFCPQCGKDLLTEPKSDDAAHPILPTTRPNSGIIGSSALKARSATEAACEESPAPPSHVREETSTTCASCHALLPEDALYCHRCGERTRSRQPQLRASVRTPQGHENAVKFDGEPITIGTAKECDVVIVGDEFVSRRHARLAVADGRVLLTDLGSSNGTYLRVRGPIELREGDEIMIGATQVRISR